MLERSVNVLSHKSRLGQIVPLSLVCSDRTAVLRRHLTNSTFEIKVANFGIRPAKIFHKVDQRATIILASKKKSLENTEIYSTRYHHWLPGNESVMIHGLSYTNITSFVSNFGWPKLGDEIGQAILQKLVSNHSMIKDHLGSAWTSYYHGIGRYWLKAYDFIPTYIRNGVPSRSSTLFELSFNSERVGKTVIGLINSSLFFWYWVLYGDDFHLNRTLIENFPLFKFDPGFEKVFAEIEKNVDLLMKDYHDKSILRQGRYPTGIVTLQEFYPRQSKGIIDKLDSLFGILYGLTPDEVSYITNYDIDFRTDDDEISE